MWRAHRSDRGPGAAVPSRAPRTVRLVAGVAIVALSVAGLLLGAGPRHAGAQQDPATFAPVAPTATAFYMHPVADAVPGVLSEEFPPAIVCLLVPETCRPELDSLTDPVSDLLPALDDLPTAPVPPVAPGTLPVATVAGATRYESALRFDLPSVPPGHRIDRFVLRLTETAPTFSLDSPALRQAVLAILVSVEEQAPAQEQFAALLESDLLATQFLGVEACPVTGSFEAGDAQPAAAIPAVDCILGANGRRTADGHWEFDLTLAAAAWQRGDLPDAGVLLRPIGAPNLAYGDPDPSTNEQVSFAASDEAPPAVSIATSVPPEPATAAPAAPTTTGRQIDRGRPVAVTRPPVADSSGRRPDDQAAVEVSEPATPDVAQDPVASAPLPRPTPRDRWWYWMMVPSLLGGMYVTTRALTAPAPPPGAAGGAMTALLQRRGRGGA